jgi:hypothetical protein
VNDETVANCRTCRNATATICRARDGRDLHPFWIEDIQVAALLETIAIVTITKNLK